MTEATHQTSSEQAAVADDSQGVPLAMTQELARCWGTDYDWRKCEAKLNDLPNFITEIDRLDIHFIHVRSRHEDALPLIVTRGWPGSVIEQLKIIEPLANPTAHGASASDAFHLVIPSMPGYGFSGKPNTTGWDPVHIARGRIHPSAWPPGFLTTETAGASQHRRSPRPCSGAQPMDTRLATSPETTFSTTSRSTG